MKQNVNHLTFLSFLLTLSILIIGCGGDDNKKKKTEEELQLEKLKFSWTLDEAKLGGSAIADAAKFFNSSDVTLIISGTYAKDAEYNYTINATPAVDASPWPSTGKLKFGSPVATTLIRKATPDEDRTLNYAITNEGKTLTISFAYNGENYPNGRVSSTEGNWEFKFTRP
jgi:hypothetical protein